MMARSRRLRSRERPVPQILAVNREHVEGDEVWPVAPEADG
jgi:hypothetical protein